MLIADLKKEIVRISHLFYGRGWSLATSSNYSVRLDAGRILITASGKDKGRLAEEDIIEVDPAGNVTQPANERPSAETQLHCALYRFDMRIGAVLHTHSVFATVLSSLRSLKTPLAIGDYEMLKAFQGVSTHAHTEFLPVFANDQDIKRLGDAVIAYLSENRSIHGFLIAGHGLYTWGQSLQEALHHAEACEFLLECEYRKLAIIK